MKTRYYIFILIFVVAILYLIGFKNKSKAYKIFSLFLIFDVLMNYVNDELYSWFKIYNHFFINIIFLFQFGILSLFYSYSFEDKKWRNVVEISLILVSGYLLIKYLVFPESFFLLHYWDIYLTIFPIIVYGVVYLYNEYDKPQELYYANLALLIHFIIYFFCYLSWPLHSISIDHTYMIEFNKTLNKSVQILDPLGFVFSFFLLYQLKKLKT